MMTTYDPVAGVEQPYPIINIISMIAWGLGYFGMPHILLRFMAIEDEEKLTLSRRVATIWVVISLAVAVLIGVIGLAMSDVGALKTLTGSDSETIIVQIADLLSKHGILPALLAGTILAGILASTMSTADSQLLAASSAVSSDLFGDRVAKTGDKKKAMNAARFTLLAIAVIAAFIARDPNSSVFGIVSFAWAVSAPYSVLSYYLPSSGDAQTGRAHLPDDFRRSYGIHLEIPRTSSRRCMEHL